MFSQNCSCLPNKNQSSFTGSLPHHLSLSRNLTSKSFSKFEDSSQVNIDFSTKNQVQLSRNTANIMDFVYSFGDSSSRFNFRNPVPRRNCKEMIDHCNSISTMPLASSHLVGGFVGSKSQLGRRPTNNGFGVKMWDIIRELVDLVGNSSTDISVKNKSQKSGVEKRLNGMYSMDNKLNYQVNSCCNNTYANNSSVNTEQCQKQSYADVTKTKLPILRENYSVKTVKESFTEGKNNCLVDCNISVIEPTCCPLFNKNQLPNRDRIASTCSADSEDSFIVFECCDENDDSFNEEDSSSDDESIPGVHGESTLERTASFSEANKQPLRKVRFAEGKNLTTVHPMVTWDYAYRSARRGPWEMMARDSERFKCRIASTEAVLKPVLDPQHRASIFRQRFTD